MSGTQNDELKKMVQLYIDDESEAGERLKKPLELVSADIRYKLIVDVRDERYGTFDVLHVSVERNDVEMIRHLLCGLSSEQIWQVMQLSTGNNRTALHLASVNGSTDTTRYLLECTPQDNRFKYIMMTDKWGDTALHDAARQDHLYTVQVQLSFLSLEEQIQLLKVTNNNFQSVADILSAKYAQVTDMEKQLAIMASLSTPEMELATLKIKMAEEKIEHNRVLEAMEAVDGKWESKLSEQKIEHDRALAAAEKKLQVLEEELAEQKTWYDGELQALRKRQAELDTKQMQLDRKLVQIDLHLQQGSCSSEMGDSENVD